jgi:hypothetical protein
MFQEHHQAIIPKALIITGKAGLLTYSPLRPSRPVRTVTKGFKGIL